MKPIVDRSTTVDWSNELCAAQEECPALLLAVFAPSGEMLAANRGMQRALAEIEGSQLSACDCFVNPTFQNLASASTVETIVFEGLITLGNRRDPGVSLPGRVYRRADELLCGGTPTSE